MSAAGAGPPPGRLAGKRALVTGAGSGVGRAIAIAFAGEGARLALVGRREAALEQTARATGNCAPLVLPADLTAARTPGWLRERVESAWGGLDVLVNNAAAYAPGRLEDTSDADWEATLATNLRAPFRLLRELLPALARSRGSVIQISSNLGGRPVPGAAAYAVSKAGLDMLTQVVALEWGGRGVRANSLRLGVVDTPIHEARALADPAQFRRQMGELHPLGRIGEPEEAAAAAVWLASAEAAWVTGALIAVDGGLGLA